MYLQQIKSKVWVIVIACRACKGVCDTLADCTQGTGFEQESHTSLHFSKVTKAQGSQTDHDEGAAEPQVIDVCSAHAIDKIPAQNHL